MNELLPRDNAQLSVEADRVLEFLYDEFDRTSAPVDELTTVLALQGTMDRVSTTVSRLLNSQELAPYLRRDNGKYVPNLRAALRLRKERDLALAAQLYSICHDLMKKRIQEVPAGNLPQALAAAIPRLAQLLSFPGFVSINMHPSTPMIQIFQRILDADSLGEFLVQQEDSASSSLEPVKYPAAATRIDAIQIDGFRSFSASALNGLGGLTAFAGPNEAGKTNLLRALKFLSTTASQGIHAALERERGLGQLLRRDGTTESLLLRVVLESELHEKFFYSVRTDRSSTVDEGLSRFEGSAFLDPAKPPFVPKSTELTFQTGGLTRVWPTPRPPHPEAPVLADGQSLLATLSDLSKFDAAIRVRESMRSWAFFSFEPSRLRSDERGTNGTLHADGSNLPEAINALGQHHPKKFDELASAFVDLLPEAERFKSEVGLTGAARLLLFERGLTDPLSHVDYSDGMLRILALLYLAFSPDRPSLVCIEEPENGLYPRLIEAMLEALRMLSKTTQVFLTTHSVTLLDRLKPDEVVLVHRDALGTQLTRLDSREDVKKFATRLGLGAQLLSGNLEDRS